MFGGVSLAVAPDVELAIRAVAILRGLEPRVLGRGVVEHHVHHDADAAPVGGGDQLLEVRHGAVSRIDGAVVRHVIAVVHLRRYVDRRQPDGVDAQLLQIVQPPRHAGQIAVAVAGAVLKTLRINLVDDAVLPPGVGLLIAVYL